MAELKFEISGKERIEVENFKRNHQCNLPDASARERKITREKKKLGAIGGRYKYGFAPTSLGTAITVECAYGEKKNVTDYDSW